MKHLFFGLLCVSLSNLSWGLSVTVDGETEVSSESVTVTQEALSPRDALMTAFMAEGTDLAAAEADARKAGVSEATIVEAHFIRLLNGQNSAALFEYLPVVEEHLNTFEVGMGMNFISHEEVEGYVAALHAIIANRSGEFEKFEAYYKEASWKAPGFFAATGLTQLRTQEQQAEYMRALTRSVVVPMDTVISSVEGDSNTLAELLGDNKAILLDFWASWCTPCIDLMPKMKHKAEVLSTQGIYVAAFNNDDRNQLAKAKQIREEHEMQSVNWLLGPSFGGLSEFLSVDSLPRVVLINAEGQVLFNGHPSDKNYLDAALAEVGATL